jgi:hypothetical protein
MELSPLIPPTIPLGAYPGMIGLYSNVTPYTEKDRVTFINQLEGFIKWINGDVIDFVDARFVDFVNAVNTQYVLFREEADKLSGVSQEERDRITALVGTLNTTVAQAVREAQAAAAAAEADSSTIIAVQDDTVAGFIKSGSTAAGAATSDKIMAASIMDLSPIFIETRDTGLILTSPANLRSSQGTTQYAGGGFTNELAIQVTGVKGSTVLTSSEPAKIAGLGTAKFAAVLNSTDKLSDFFVSVMGNDGATKVNLRTPLKADFTGTLSAKYDSPLGQHLTQAATRAFVRHTLKNNDVTTGRGPILSGNWDSQPPVYNREWSRNAALVAYGTLNSVAPVVRTDLNVQGVHNPIGSVDKVELYPTVAAAGQVVGTHRKGHGAVAVLYTGRLDTTVEFYTSAQRSTESGAAYALRVTVTADGVELYNERLDAYMNRIIVPVSGADRVEINVTNDNDTDTPYYISLSNLLMRQVTNRSRIGQGNIVILADSWGEFYDGAMGRDLAEFTGAKVTTRAKGGTTTDWALAWFNSYVLPVQPDECWIHFYINDSNQTAQNFTDPDGNVRPLWPAGLTLDQAGARWKQNIMTLIALCQKAGIRPVVFIPSGTASDAQTSRTIAWASLIDRPRLLDYNASTAELADPVAYVNTVGKRTGSRVMSGTPKYASGPAPTDGWI